jgi:hypothetical protein
LETICKHGTLRCDFERQQNNKSTGKSISNRLRTHNIRFRRPVNIDQRIIDQNDYATGGKIWLKGKNDPGLWE